MKYIILILVGVVFMDCSFSNNQNISECKMEKYQYLIGKTLYDIDTVGYKGKIRIIKPNMLVDMQFIPDRLNIKVDENSTVIKIYCG